MDIRVRLTADLRGTSAVLGIALAIGAGQIGQGATKDDSFHAYVDSGICSHLMLGPISEARIQCSKNTHKQGDEPVLVRINDNLVFEVDKTKLIDPLVSQMVSATGETKERDGRIKLGNVSPLAPGTIKPGAPGYEMLDVRHFKLTGEGAKVHEQIRHELATMPYVTEYDFISFTMADSRVILTGWTVRQTNRSTAYNIVKDIRGVESVTNNIEILPLGKFDMQIRAGVRARLQRVLARYFWSSGSAIRIIVKNGNVVLLGLVSSAADTQLAEIQANGVPGVFKVFNMLRVESQQAKPAATD